MQSCPRCQGHLVTVEQYDHGVRFQDYRCLMCGRYWPIQTVMAQVDVAVGRLQEYKPWKPVSDDKKVRARELLTTGICIEHVAKRVQMNAVTLRKLVKREGLAVVSARPRRGVK